MNIKDAYRYAKKIDGWIGEINYIISKKQMKITEEHQKIKGHKDKLSETRDVTPECLYEIGVVDLVYLIEDLLKEKALLNKAVEVTKRFKGLGWEENGNDLYLDSAIDFNKSMRGLIYTLCNLISLKTSKVYDTGKDYNINNEGNQVSYSYPIERTIEPTFDKNIIRKKYRKLSENMDKLSQLIELKMTENLVTFDPQYSVHMNIDEVIETWNKNKKEG